MAQVLTACAVMFQGSEEPFRTGSGNAQINAPEAHSVLPDAGSKACSKCKVTKPLAGFFKDKSKPDGLYSQVSLRPLCSIPGDCCRRALARAAAGAAATEIRKARDNARIACLATVGLRHALLCTSQQCIDAARIRWVQLSGRYS